MRSKDKILGVLYGQAIGDAIGMPSELWPVENNLVEKLLLFLMALTITISPKTLKKANTPMTPIRH